MRVLWLCTCPLSDSDISGTGSWLGAMADLLATEGVELGIIAFGPVASFTRRDYRHVKQWLVPGESRLGREGLPQASLVRAVVKTANEFSPDLIHVWGTEFYWGLVCARGLLEYPSLLEMQGLKGQIAKVFCGGLTLREQLRCVGIKEVLKRRTMHSDRRDFARWAPFEEEIIRGHQFVDVQTDWVAAQVKAVHPAAHLFKVDLALRQPFHDADGWRGANQPVVFCSAAYSSPFKGLHVAIRALGLLRQRIPAARLRIAGGLQQVGIRQNGYMRWVNRLVRQLKLGSAVEWLGPLNAEQIVAELKRAAAVVFPTFIENCCTGMQEALAVGAPVAASYAGGIPSLGRDEDSCIFFPPGDEAMCAHQLERLLTDHDLAARLSRRAREIASQRHDRESLVRWQLDIYRKVIAQWTSGRRSSAVAASAAASLTPC